MTKAVRENQAITENRCSFYCKSLMIGKEHTEARKEEAFSFPTFACLGNNTSFPRMKANQ